MEAETTDFKTSQLNSKLVKQILDCCQMYPAAPALNLVPHTMLLRAARKVGLVVDYQQLRWSDRMSEQFIAECFLLVAHGCAERNDIPVGTSEQRNSVV